MPSKISAVPRNPQGTTYVVLGVVSNYPNGIHGYELKRQCERLFGQGWRITLGEVYRILDQLSGQNLIEPALTTGKALRKAYRVTDRGRSELDDFIGRPATDAPRVLRDELAIKLMFARPMHSKGLRRVLECQRTAYLRETHELRAARRRLRAGNADTFISELLLENAERRVDTELAWLDDVTRQISDRGLLECDDPIDTTPRRVPAARPDGPRRTRRRSKPSGVQRASRRQ